MSSVFIFTLISKCDLQKISKYKSKDLEQCFDKDGHSPLAYCCIKRNIPVLLQLLELGVDVCQLDRNGMAAMHYAARDGYEDIVQHLVNRGQATIKVACRHKNLPLHYAVQNNRYSMVRYLLQLAGPDVLQYIDYPNISGKIPMGLAKVLAEESDSRDILNLLNGATNCSDENYSKTYMSGDPHDLNDVVRRIAELELTQKALMEKKEPIKSEELFKENYKGRTKPKGKE